MPSLLANLGSWFGGTVNTVITPFYILFAYKAIYCFTTRTNVDNHESATQTLANHRQRVQEKIASNRLEGLTEATSTLEWLQRVDRAISEEAANRQQYEQRRRILGCYSLNCWGNYKISKRAVEKLVYVKECISAVPPLDTVSEARRAPPVVDLPIQAYLTPGRQAIIEEVLQFIKADDTVAMIGMSGPDKDEKTQLLKKINNSFIGRSFFDFVIFVTASTECSVQHIQAQIISRLHIQKHDDVATQATRISDLLWKKNILVLVDDLHGQLDLRAVGIPYPLGAVQVGNVGGRLKRKVVITSPPKSRSIHNLMDVDKQIEVPSVEEDQARQLFNQSFGAQEDLFSDPHIGTLAIALVSEIKGQPSELKRLGKLMKGQRDLWQWGVTIEAVRKANLRNDDASSSGVGKIVRNLEGRKEDLIAKRKDVYQNIENAKREGKTPTNEVQRWLEKGDAIICNADAISANYELKKDVTLGAAEELLAVQGCLDSFPSTIIVESGPRPVIEMPGPHMSAENHNLLEALKFIKDDPTGMIGIWGPGGVGKTHLLNNIHNALVGDLAFDNVLHVTAAKGCSVEKIQADIVRELKLGQDDNPKSQRCIIFDFLKKRSFLVLLDDLWDRIDLEAVGIPYPHGTVNQPKRKVVLTTRSRNVCGQMEVRKELKVAYMQKADAWKLFQEKVGHETLSSPRIEPLAKKLVKELKGLPLALITIGRAMYAKRYIDQWEYAIQCMQNPCYDKDDPLGMEKAVLSQLKFSYDSLPNETLKHCFSISSLWPEDLEIHKEDLAKCWIGFGLVDECDIQSSYTKAYSLMGDLEAACLIDSCGELCNSFKMHDVVRDMAHWINNDRFFVRAGVGTDKYFSVPWIKAECISLMSNAMKKFPPFCSSPCPMELRMLCLGNNALDGSIIEIKKFTSLTYLDLCYNGLHEIPEELCSLVNLEHLDLSRNRYIREVPHCFGNLINLKFLYLGGTSIQKIAEGVISSLIALQVIDLRLALSSVCSGDFISSRLCKELLTLSHLKAIGITVRTFPQYDTLIREGANLPIRHLSVHIRTRALIFDILSHDSARRTLYELEIEDCHMVQIIVRNSFATLNKLSLKYLYNLREIKFMEKSPASLFPLLTCLEVSSHQLNDLSWTMYLPCLEHLNVFLCNKMQQAFRSHHLDNKCSGQQSLEIFPCLRYLHIRDCHLLVSIGDLEVTFPSLERLEIVGCSLRTLPFQMDSLPPKLRVLVMDVKSWRRLELEEGMKSKLEPMLVLRGALSLLIQRISTLLNTVLDLCLLVQ